MVKRTILKREVVRRKRYEDTDMSRNQQSKTCVNYRRLITYYKHKEKWSNSEIWGQHQGFGHQQGTTVFFINTCLYSQWKHREGTDVLNPKTETCFKKEALIASA